MSSIKTIFFGKQQILLKVISSLRRFRRRVCRRVQILFHVQRLYRERDDAVDEIKDLLPVTLVMPVRRERRHTLHAALNLIKDQQEIVFVAELPHALQEFRIGRIDASLSLHRFKDDGTGFGSDLLLHRFQIIERGESHAAHQRTESLLIMAVPRYRKCADRASVEAVLHRDDFMGS